MVQAYRAISSRHLRGRVPARYPRGSSGAKSRATDRHAGEKLETNGAGRSRGHTSSSVATVTCAVSASRPAHGLISTLIPR